MALAQPLAPAPTLVTKAPEVTPEQLAAFRLAQALPPRRVLALVYREELGANDGHWEVAPTINMHWRPDVAMWDMDGAHWQARLLSVSDTMLLFTQPYSSAAGNADQQDCVKCYAALLAAFQQEPTEQRREGLAAMVITEKARAIAEQTKWAEAVIPAEPPFTKFVFVPFGYRQISRTLYHLSQ